MTAAAPLHVVVATDEGFAMPTAVTLRSLADRGGGPFHVTVLHDSVSAATQEAVGRSVPDEEIELSWVDVSGFHVGASRPTHLTAATYFRLLVARALPSDVGRVLYLDVDVVVRRDLEPLLSVDLEGTAVAAVQSVHYPFVATRGAVNDWLELGADPSTPFFNAGVLVIDLDRWRSERIEERALDYLRSEHLGGGADQEALNVALAGRWKRLAPVWNQQTPMLSNDYGAHLVFTAAEIDEARRDPAVVHFQTRPKPWHRGCDHPWLSEWLKHAEAVDFDRVCDLRERSVTAEARWRVKRAASALMRGR